MMDYSKPTLVVISGPNGAGKSTHAQTLLPPELSHCRCFDRDKTVQQIRLENGESSVPEEELVRKMEEQLSSAMRAAIETRTHFYLETPLSHPQYWRYLDLFERHHYQIELVYLGLDQVNDCQIRVHQRATTGGHDVAPSVVKGIFQDNLRYLNEYSDTFSAIRLYDGMLRPDLLVTVLDHKIVYAQPYALKKNWLKKGLSNIAAQVQEFQRQQTKIKSSNQLRLKN